MRLNREEEAAIIGMILGDGYLQKTGSKNARLRLEHQATHKDYLIWKISLLPRLFQGRPRSLLRVHPITKKTYHYIRHQSNSSPILGKLRDIFYKKGRKIIPENLEKFLKSEITLAIWYLDNGYYHPRDRCAYLYLGKVSRKEAEIAHRAIFKKFGLRNRILDKKGKGFALYLPFSEAKILKEKIGKYLIPVMSYKLPS